MMKTFVDEIKRRRSELPQVLADTSKNLKIRGDVSEGVKRAKENATRLSGGIMPKGNPALSGQVNSSGKRTDLDTNYMENSLKDIADGNLFGAAYNENMHNIKDGEYGLGWGASDMFNYQDNAGYGGLLDAKYREIEDHFSDGFKYDYRDDDMYKQILALKEKEADKAYEDGYAQLTQQFDGDIPVNMINKLLATKQEIVDSADSYIPQLREMAYDMYLNDGKNLYDQYSILKSEDDTEYNRWNDERNLLVQGVLQNEANKQYREEMDLDKEKFEYNKGQDEQNRKEATADAILNAALKIQALEGISLDAAMRRATEYYGG